MELYVHIPFCVRKCAYCDFLSAPNCDAERDAYVAALVREIEGQTPSVFTSVFFGGGTPSILTPTQFQTIADAIKRCHTLTDDCEWTVEANPGTLDAQKLQTYRRCGVNRISLGMQSADDTELKEIGRIHCHRETEEAVALVRAAGFANLNLDLMMGLPTQTIESWTHTLDAAIALAPTHISAYSLILEEGTPMAKRPAGDFPDEDTDRDMYDRTLRTMEQNGYRQYEISNFAKPGFACRHNLGYWDLTEYLGVGLGASSLIRRQRLKNTQDMTAYLLGSTPTVEETLDDETSMSEWAFLGLRKTDGISQKAFRELFHVDLFEAFPEAKKLDGLLTTDTTGDRLKLSRRGLDLANLVFEVFCK